MARLFFALQPSPVECASLHRAAVELSSRFGGRAIDAADLHLTLCFLGEVAGDRIPVLLNAAACVRANAVELSLDVVEHWPKARILCAVPGSATDLQPVTLLASTLCTAATEAGFSPDAQPFRPHVTLLRRLPDQGAAGNLPPVALMPPLSLRAKRFALMRSESQPIGQTYRVIGCWPKA